MTRKLIALALLALASLAAFASRGNGGAVRGAAARAGMMGGRFTEVEYLQSTGTQYIDTGYAFASVNVRVDMRLNIPTPPSQSSYWLFGADGTTAANMFSVRYSTSGSPQCYMNLGGTSEILAWVGYYSGQTADFYGYYLSGVVAFHTMRGTSSKTQSGLSPISGRNLYLLARNVGGAAWGNKAIVYIYSASVTDNGILVRDFVPVRDTAGNGYMLDKVTGQLFGNSGTGAFIVGPDK